MPKNPEQNPEQEDEFISLDEVHRLSHELANKILTDVKAGKIPPPHTILAMLRGAGLISLCLDQQLIHEGVDTAQRENKIPANVYSKKAPGDFQIRQEIKTIEVRMCEKEIKDMKNIDCLLIVDDVFETGKSVETVINFLQSKLGNKMPKKILIAVLFYKKDCNETNIVPDYYVTERTKKTWLVFPWEQKAYQFLQKQKPPA